MKPYFANVKTNFADVNTNFADVKTHFTNAKRPRCARAGGRAESTLLEQIGASQSPTASPSAARARWGGGWRRFAEKALPQSPTASPSAARARWGVGAKACATDL